MAFLVGGADGILAVVADGILVGVTDGIIGGVADGIVAYVTDGILAVVADNLLTGVADGILATQFRRCTREMKTINKKNHESFHSRCCFLVQFLSERDYIVGRMAE